MGELEVEFGERWVAAFNATREFADCCTVDVAYEEVLALLTAERSRLDALADALLDQETLDQFDAYRIAGLSEPEAVSVD